MSNSVYKINKAINQAIEFKGLKAQYIWYLAAGMVLLMILFALMYIMGLPSLFCVGFITAIGSLLVFKTYKMSHTYGQYGMMKALAKRHIPKYIRTYSRAVFLKI